MAYLAIFYKLLIVSGILAVVTGSENTITKSTSSVGTLDIVTTSDPENASSAISSINNTTVTMETYSMEGTSLRDKESPTPYQEEEENTSPISDATTKDLITPAGPQEVPTSQRSDTQASSATAITLMSYTGTSSSKVSRNGEPYTFSTPHTSVTVPVAGNTLGHGLLTGILIFALIFIILLICYLRRKRRRYSFDLFHKTAEDANIPLSSPVIPGAFEAIPDREDNKDVEQVNEDKVNHDKTSVVNLNLSEEINEKQNNCEIETNHIPANLGQENMDNLDDWNFKPQESSFTDIDLMDCAITE